MMTSLPRESKMLELTRKWRREAFEADQKRSPEERTRRTQELLGAFGLSPYVAKGKQTEDTR